MDPFRLTTAEDFFSGNYVVGVVYFLTNRLLLEDIFLLVDADLASRSPGVPKENCSLFCCLRDRGKDIDDR